ncbi:protein CLT1, chloroplastic-like isoform X5 [Zingiber officinale]|uniref:protein CLT1, chloroplastic-like isoform X5 n=1 Tax=Zingiber officinale TaxID=94328 RepID=UPI001C4CDCBF|nr:protein CLT1, chloroplastic-like isoform X5 [Zingiber officinale]
MSLCYRLLPGASIIPPSDSRLQILRLRPVSVRSALCDGISRALRAESRSRFSEPVVPPFQEGGWSFSRVRSRSAKGIGAIGEMIGELEVDLRRQKTAEVLAAAAVTVVLGTGNRVLYKLALVPLKEYPFFLAQFATFGVAVLSGASIPILSQTFLVWQLLFSVVFLKRRFRLTQILGCFLVTIGVVITVTSGSGAGISLKNAGIFWSLLMILSFLLQAADTILKEIIFLDAAKKLKGGSIDLFVVNSFGSAFQALFICLLMPFMSKLWGIPFNQLPSYIRDGTACFLNVGSLSGGCEGAPLLPVLFVIVNMAFNISLLHLLKISSAVVSCLASTFSVPLAIYAFTLPLPYIGVASSLPAGFVTGAMVLVGGLLLYCWCSLPRTTSDNKVL